MTGADLIALIRKQPVGFVCALVSVGCALALYLRGDLIAENQTKYEATAKQAARVQANLKNAVNLPEQLAEAQTLGKELEGRLMRASQLASNLQYFYKLEAENGIKLTDLRQGPVSTGRNAPKGAYLGVPYSLAIQGSFKQVAQFMTRLENGRHFCRYSSASFAKLGGNASTADLMSVSLNIELLGTP
jgi:Tfp pilus assembly protein PilO